MFVLGVENGDVYLEVGNADVVAAFVTVLRQCGGYIFAESRFSLCHVDRRHGKRGLALFGKIEECFKPRNAFTVCL